MKKITLLLCVLSLLITACKPETEPESMPNEGGQQINDTTEIMVKKYLVKEFLGDTMFPIRIIDWNEDYTKINHIRTFASGISYYQLDHDFEYYGEDSIRIIVTQPQNSWAWPLFTTCTCHLEEGRIHRIDYYRNSIFQTADLFEYDELGRLVKRESEGTNIEIHYKWEGENVISIEDGRTGEIIETYGDFCDHIHPDYTLPYYLFNGYYQHLTEPLWKNGCSISNECQHDSDADGYITRIYYFDEQGNKTTFKIYEYSN